MSASIETHRLGIRGGVSLQLSVDEDALSDAIPSRLICTLVDELLANVAVSAESPLNVEVDASRVSGGSYTRITVSATAPDLNPSDKAHTWFHDKGVAERAVRSAGAGVSVLIPDQTSVMVMVGSDEVDEEPLESPQLLAVS